MQDYKGIILNSNKKTYPNKNKVSAVVNPNDYNDGAKLMEHSYLGNRTLCAFEELINKERGKYAGNSIIWAGSQSNNEPYSLDKQKVNIYTISNKYGTKISGLEGNHYRYIINEDKKLYIDTDRIEPDEYGFRIHPLPLLCADVDLSKTNDYKGLNGAQIGKWKRNVVVVSDNKPSDEYKEINILFKEITISFA